MTLSFAVGSAALMSFIIVGAKPSVCGDSGACITPLIMSVKWVVFETTHFTALSGVELAVSLSVHLLATVCDSHLSLSSMVESIEPDKR